jgi:hypothetical protein
MLHHILQFQSLKIPRRLQELETFREFEQSRILNHDLAKVLDRAGCRLQPLVEFIHALDNDGVLAIEHGCGLGLHSAVAAEQTTCDVVTDVKQSIPESFGFTLERTEPIDRGIRCREMISVAYRDRAIVNESVTIYFLANLYRQIEEEDPHGSKSSDGSW